MKDKKPIITMICFARSGGTLLNKCLGVLPNTVVISEVNPLGGGWGKEKENSFTTIKTQAKNWYNIELESNDFVENALELKEYCDKNNLYLILRDWSFVNFSSHQKNNYDPPNDFLILKYLQEKTDILPFAFVRDSIDVWLSRGMPDVNIFFEEYSNYINKLKENNIKIFKYEDFCGSPDKEMKKICEYIGVEFNDFYKKFNNFEKVNGDVQITKGSRGGRSKKIKKLRRRIITIDKIKELNASDKMKEVNFIMKYKGDYFDNIFIKYKILLFSFFKKIL